MEQFEGLAGTVPGTTGNADPYSAFPIAGDFGQVEGDGTGRFGVTPLGVGSGIASTATSTVTGVFDWLNTPFKKPMTITSLFLIVGFVLLAILLWNLILYHIRIAAETI